MRSSPLLTAVLLAGGVLGGAATPDPPQGALDVTRLGLIRPLVERAIADLQLPGAVVLVGRGDRVFYRDAIGNRAIVPAREPMTIDTIFDVASLTKVVATTTSIMVLLERGEIGLDDAVAAHIAEFGKYGKQRITIRHLLTHRSGLRPDFDLALDFAGRETAIQMACEEVPVAAPGERFIYSDLNFILLGEIVARVSGEPLERFAAAHVFTPLGMAHTMFLPPRDLVPRIAPTEICRPTAWPCKPGPDAVMLRGVVHDPTARRMGGVAGHAGVFSTADDLSRFCRMLLHGGTLEGVRVLSPLSVALMTRAPEGMGPLELRGLGWDIDSRFSTNRGALFPIGSFGHTGFTGTSLWIDPDSGVYVVFLSNRVHPNGKGDVGRVRNRVANIVAAAIPDPDIAPGTRLLGADYGPRAVVAPTRPAPGPVLTGIDVLRVEQFARLRGRRVGLITNQAGRARGGESTIDLLRGAPGVTLIALFSPEHGIRGQADEKVASTRDEKTGLPVYSLYGDTDRPTSEMLRGIDTLVVDLPDAGVRFYTYPITMAYALEEAARRGIAVVVLDRPNPVNGWEIEGPIQDADVPLFKGYWRMPTRHGMTIGELARLFNGEKKIGAALTVVPMQNWTRDQWFDETGLDWVNPSPNLRTLNQATLYPGIGSIEYSNISVGRGTDAPFEQVGATWIDGAQLAAALNARGLPGIRFYPVTFTPASSKYAGEVCRGVFMVVTDREAIRPVRIGLELAAALFRLYPDRFDPSNTWQLLGSPSIVEQLRAGIDPAEISQSWAAGEGRWRELRAKYLLYY